MARRKILSAKFLKLRTGVTLRATQHDVERNSEVSRLIDLLAEHERTGETSAFVHRAMLNQMRLDEAFIQSPLPAAEAAPRAPSLQQVATRNEAADKQSDQVQVPSSDPAVSLPSRPTMAPAASGAEGFSQQADSLVDSLLVRQLESAPARVDPVPVPAAESGGALRPRRKMGAGAMAMGG